MLDLTGVKLVVWDLDGTIIDSYGVYAAIITEAAELRGLAPPTAKTMRHNFHGSLDQSIKGAFDMVEGIDFETLLNDFLRIQENYYHEPEEHIYPDARDLAKRLHAAELPQVIATNREHAGRGNASPRYLVEHSSFKSYISEVACGEEVSARKPDAAVLADISAAKGLQGAEILVIGDQFVDAQLAQNLGARAIIVNRGDEPVPHLDSLGDCSDFLSVVSSLNEVKEYT